MKYPVLTLVSTMALTSFALAAGFSNGNVIKQNTLEGRVTVYCNSAGQSTQGFYTCQGVDSLPGSADFFVGPAITEADSVNLLATHEDGTTRTKSEKYDGTSGRSKKRINLLVWTLLQKPLLKGGQNRIDYTLTSLGQSLASGQFEVDVVAGKNLSCRPAVYNSFDLNDCRIDGALCQRYFNETQCE